MRSAWSYLRVLGLIAVLSVTTFVGLSQVTPETPTFQSTTNLVFLDVTVVDKKGRIVTKGLDKDDFSVTEDKTPQRIFSFESPETHIPDKKSRDDEPDGNSPVTILVMDQLNTNMANIAFLRDAMKKYLEAQPSRLPAPTEFMVVGNRSTELVQGYTRSRDELLFALKHLPNETPYKLSEGFKIERFLQSIQALQQIALQNKGIAGRKDIVWVGPGGPGVIEAYINPNSIDKLNHFVHSTMNMLTDARMTLFVIYPGLSINNPGATITASGASTNQGSHDNFGGDTNFGSFVNATGGTLFYDENDVDALIERSQRLGSQYYTLTYQPQSAGALQTADGKYRHVHVSIRDPNLRAITKEGYYAPDASKQMDSRQQTIVNVTQALQSDIPFNGMQVKIAEVARHPDSRTIAFTVLVKSKDVQWEKNEDGSSKTNLILAAECLSSTRQVLSSKLNGVSFSANTQDQGALANRTLRLYLSLRLPKSIHRLRVAVETDDGGKVGSAELDRAAIEAAPSGPTLVLTEASSGAH
jgi:VWFA-related protein